jgi:hypothetical protein
MARTQIRGSTDIMAATISVDRLVSGWDSSFLKKDGTVAFTADIPAGGFKITGLGNAVGAQDAVNLQTMQSYLNGIAIKPAVRGVFTANQALSGLPTNDGITYVATDTALLTGQTSLPQNGPWVLAAGAWTRPAWWAAASVQKPAVFFVTEGTTFHDTKWTTITDGNITVDTTAISVTQDSSGTTYSNGSGLSLTGATFAVKAGNGIEFDGSLNVQVKSDATRLGAVDVNGIGILNGAAGQLIVGAVTTGKASWVTMSGDATISSTGVITVSVNTSTGFLKYSGIVIGEVPGGTLNGANTAFTLAAAPVANTEAIYYNGQRLQRGAGNDYTISGTAVTMLFAPAATDKLIADYFK